LTNTTIGHDVKIDNLCQVGHNAKVGDRVRMSGMSGVAGSSVLEDDVVLAGAAIVKDHVTVHQGATIGMDSCVISDVPAGEVWSGSPARPHRQFLRSVALINRLARSKPGHSS
jgi:UDP-3-O-[3-hydroxymyristoyl] glucosamine N-acyltransferase